MSFSALLREIDERKGTVGMLYYSVSNSSWSLIQRMPMPCISDFRSEVQKSHLQNRFSKAPHPPFHIPFGFLLVVMSALKQALNHAIAGTPDRSSALLPRCRVLGR